MGKPIYLDYNATTPHDPEVVDAMRPYLEEEFGNPSSLHWYGIRPKKAVMDARRRVASLLNCEAKEIIFTSGGTESNNHALRGVAFARRSRGTHLITTAIEHSSVQDVCEDLEERGWQVERVGGIDYTVKDGIVYDARQLLEDVRRMVAEAKQSTISEQGSE
mgnify:CR=1 FL=1